MLKLQKNAQKTIFFSETCFLRIDEKLSCLVADPPHTPVPRPPFPDPAPRRWSSRGRALLSVLRRRDWWCRYVSLRGNPSRSYLRFILAEAPGSTLGKQRLTGSLAGYAQDQVPFTVNTLAGAIAGVTYECLCVGVGAFCHGAFAELGCSR